MDWNVVKFITKFQYKKAEEVLPLEEKIEMIEQAIKDKRVLKIVYLKGKDEKSEREILPKRIGEMEFNGFGFLGLKAQCLKRGEERTFNVERILEISLD
jgi:predicted DNA-binding transcriptional regulator YafY